jgi:hypothetical protein
MAKTKVDNLIWRRREGRVAAGMAPQGFTSDLGRLHGRRGCALLSRPTATDRA